MGKHLITNLLNYTPNKRYSADVVLKHPWITRNSFDEIPLTYVEVWKRRDIRNIALQVNLELFKKPLNSII